jgi:hypothetical protein
VIDNVVWTNSWLNIAGASCGLTGVGAGEELKDRYGEPERGGVNESRQKFFSKEMKTPTRRTRIPTHFSDSLPKLAKPT